MAGGANIALVSVPGDLDVSTVPALRRELDTLVRAGCPRVILNMERADYVDSAGLALILLESRALRSRGGLLSLSNVSQSVYRIMRIACLVDLIPTSRFGARRPVPELPPAVSPLWRKSILVDPQRMSDARARLTEMLRGVSLSADQLFDLTLACGEAMGNAVDHTCAEGVTLTVSGYADRVVAEVSDCGPGIEVGADEELPSESGSPERGRGIRLMRLLSDAVSIGMRPGAQGTVVRIVKLFG